MNKKQQLGKLMDSLANKLAIEKHRIIISAGAGMYFHGVVDGFDDIDVEVDSLEYEILCENYEEKISGDYRWIEVEIDGRVFSVHSHDTMLPDDYVNYCMSYDISVYSLEGLLDQYQNLYVKTGKEKYRSKVVLLTK